MAEIKLNHITKIEGHAKLNVRIENNEVKEVHLEVFEGARFFEALVKNRKYDEAPTITSRICGICSQAHLLAAINAIENAFDVKVTEQTKKLREIMILASIMQSHVLHLYFLALPDYLGFESAIAMASKYKKEVERALKLKNLVNKIITVVGGREIHSITPVVGGFSRVPSEEKMKEALKDLKDAKEDVEETVKLFSRINYPKFERKTLYFAAGKAGEYPFMEGGIKNSAGKTIKAKNYEKHFKEYLQPYSTAKFVVAEGKSFMVGAIARININSKNLSPGAKKLMKIKLPSYNPYMNNIAQAVELVHCVETMIKIIENLKLKEEEPVKFKPKAGKGVSISEAPRGMLFHEFVLDKEGTIKEAVIVTPTAQNLKKIEEDIKEYLPTVLKKPEKEIILELEKLIRAYDPCISCSTHFLEVEWERK